MPLASSWPSFVNSEWANFVRKVTSYTDWFVSLVIAAKPVRFATILPVTPIQVTRHRLNEEQIPVGGAGRPYDDGDTSGIHGVRPDVAAAKTGRDLSRWPKTKDVRRVAAPHLGYG